MPGKKSDQNRPKKEKRNSSKELDSSGSTESGNRISKSSIDFPVVGIVASAGGLEAFKKFFSHVPDNSGIAFVLVPHLDPMHESLMAELIGRHTTVEVVEASDGVTVKPNHAYVIPPNNYMTISNNRLSLNGPVDKFQAQTAIDLFLRSLAEAKQEKAICIIFSGTGTQGTLGLKAIKSSGGMAMVQEPKTAEYPAMPKSAIDTGMADFVMPAEELPEALIKYIKSDYVTGPKTEDENHDRSGHLQKLLTLIRLRTKLDFRFYRKQMLIRRIERRMSLGQINSLPAYLSFLRNHPEEVQQLSKDLLISVTSFYRDATAWQTLQERIITPLIQNKAPDEPIRAWSAGCATGEEAYSLGMLLLEEISKQQSDCPLQIFATDIDEEALDVARQAIYPETIITDVPTAQLAKFFTRLSDSSYQVSRQLRESVTFARHNILSDPPFSKLDLAVCRNQLIYLEPDVQKRVIALMHFSLKPGGILFLGSSETIGREAADLFEPISSKWRIYRRLGANRGHKVLFPSAILEHIPLPPTQMERIAPPSKLADIALGYLLERSTIACVVIDRNYEALHFAGPTERFLIQPGGPPTKNILSMSRPGLESKLRVAIQRAIRDNAIQTMHGLIVQNQSGNQIVNVEVQPLNASKQTEGLLLVSFQNQDHAISSGQSEDHSQPLPVESELLRQLEQELDTTREDLQSTIEELESSNEELKASNEEVLSMNEELQSTNEELESSKEELQSLNEELRTVNNQLQEKIIELEAANNDMANLFNSSDISTVFLDSKLHIKRFTPAAIKFFNFIPADIGRPISDIVTRFEDDSLLADVEKVLLELVPIEKEVGLQGHWWIRRIIPYRTADNRIDGVVITFVDITERKRNSESALGWLAAIVEGTTDAIYSMDCHGKILSWNNAAESLYGYTAQEMISDFIEKTIPQEFSEQWKDSIDRVYRGEHISLLESERITKSGEIVPVQLTYSPIKGSNGEIVGISVIAGDLREQKRREEALQNSRDANRHDSQALNRIKDVSSLVVEAGKRENILGDIIDTTVEVTTADMGTIQIIDKITGKLSILTSRGFDRHFLNSLNQLNPDQFLDCFTITKGERAMIEDLEVNNPFNHLATKSLMQAAQIRAYQSTPLSSRSGNLLGSLTTYYHNPQKYTEKELQFIDLLARQAADWIERSNTEYLLYQSKEQTQAILSTAADAIITFDKKGIIKSINPATEKMFGYNSAELIGKDISILLFSPWSEKLGQKPDESQNKIDKHIVGIDREVKARRKDGTTFPVEMNTSEVDHLDLYTGILRDVTYRKELEQDILAISSMEQRRIGQDMHDRCGQQLTAIGLLAHELSKSIENNKPVPPEIPREIASGVGEVLQIVRNVSRGLMQSEVTPAQLPVMLSDLAGRIADTTGIKCMLLADDKLPYLDKLQATQIFHIAQEACTNAVRHANAKTVQIHLRTIENELVLRIKDDGIGISEEQNDGLGTRIMRNRASLIGAKLKIEKNKPKGTTVTCSLRQS